MQMKLGECAAEGRKGAETSKFMARYVGFVKPQPVLSAHFKIKKLAVGLSDEDSAL